MGKLHRFVFGSGFYGVVLILLSSGTVILTNLTVSSAQEATPSPLTQLELQSELMSFADRLSMFLLQASVRDPEFRANTALYNDQVLILMAAFTIAAAPNPEVSLLDMVVLTTLGRMIYEAYWGKQYGDLVQPVIVAFRTLETDIWRIAAKALTPAEQQALRALIRTWHRKHPQQAAFALMRFSNFAEKRQEFTLAETTTARGLFKSVKEATQTVDEVRLLAERGIYLGTRVPLLVGALGEVWLSRWMQRPELAQLRGDITQVSDAADRVVQQVEHLPKNVQKERQAAIVQLMDRVSVERQALVDHFMDRVSTERQALMQDLTGAGASHPGVLTGVEQTLQAGAALATAAEGAVQALDTYTGHTFERLTAAGKTPADMADIRALMGDVAQAAQQLQGLTASLNALLLSPGWEQRLPQLLQVLDRAEKKSEDLVKYTVTRTLISGVVLLAAFLVSLLIAGFILIPYIARRFPGWSARPPT